MFDPPARDNAVAMTGPQYVKTPSGPRYVTAEGDFTLRPHQRPIMEHWASSLHG